jgi:hypothetical protein
MARRGRHTKLTPELSKRITDSVRAGNFGNFGGLRWRLQEFVVLLAATWQPPTEGHV